MGARAAVASADVLCVRFALTDAGVESGAEDWKKIAQVLEHVGDADLAATAILMRPRPEWLLDLIGMRMLPPLRR